MDADEHARRRLSFGRAVDAYHRARPTYPAEAVDWCIDEPDAPGVVLDLGAGTGRLTAVLLDLGHDVVAVDPDESMLDQLVDAYGDDPRLDSHLGAADDVPLAAASVDAVVVGQAWHWFGDDAPDEVARVVRPGGTVAALWNVLDLRLDWVRAWSRLVDGPDGARASASATGQAPGPEDGPRFGSGFAGRVHATFGNEHVLAVEDLVTLAASQSRTLDMDGRERADLLAGVDELVRTHPRLAGRERVALPYVVSCFRATRSA